MFNKSNKEKDCYSSSLCIIYYSVGRLWKTNEEDTADKESMASSVSESTEVVSGASISSKPRDLLAGLMAEGSWIFRINRRRLR